MSMGELLLVSLAVSLDAFGVALALGIYNRTKRYQKALFALSFGFFQFLFAFLGGAGGRFFNERVASVPAVIGGIIISVVGILMIKDGAEEDRKDFGLGFKMYFILGISVSIDASVIGFVTLSGIKSLLVLALNGAIIGVITLIISCLAFVMARYLRKIEIIGRYADYIGGIMLILFGLKMILF